MRTLAAAVLFVAASALVSASDDAADLDLARSRYEEAAYKDALKILEGVEPSTASQRVQVEQYRALCHIALGHTADAERAVIALVDADPTYLPPPTIASPRVLSMVAETRSRHLPLVARKLLDSGRAAFAAKNMALANEQLTLLLKLLDEPAMADRPERADFRTWLRASWRSLRRPRQPHRSRRRRPRPRRRPPHRDQEDRPRPGQEKPPRRVLACHGRSRLQYRSRKRFHSGGRRTRRYRATSTPACSSCRSAPMGASRTRRC